MHVEVVAVVVFKVGVGVLLLRAVHLATLLQVSRLSPFQTHEVHPRMRKLRTSPLTITLNDVGLF